MLLARLGSSPGRVGNTCPHHITGVKRPLQETRHRRGVRERMLALSVDRATFGSGSQFGLVLGAQRYVEHFPHLRLDQGTVERLHQTALGPETNRADNNVLARRTCDHQDLGFGQRMMNHLCLIPVTYIWCLEQSWGLADVVDRVRRHASQTGEAYLSASEFSS